jgi:hypothetical protein
VDTWKNIQEKFGVTEVKPKNVLPVNTIAKNEKVCRVTFDPSNTNDDEVLSVNGFADTLPKPLCVYPHFTHGTSATEEDSSDSPRRAALTSCCCYCCCCCCCCC